MPFEQILWRQTHCLVQEDSQKAITTMALEPIKSSKFVRASEYEASVLKWASKRAKATAVETQEWISIWHNSTHAPHKFVVIMDMAAMPVNGRPSV